jgi:Holliday junction resolvase RusA-like endonuclease
MGGKKQTVTQKSSPWSAAQPFLKNALGQAEDLDNANKVLLDSLKGWAIEDDRWVRRIVSERMEPDGEARVVVTIEQLARAPLPQLDLLGEAA